MTWNEREPAFVFDETAEPLDAYEATLAILPMVPREAIVEATAPSPPGQWSALQIICHLAAEERVLDRVDRMLRQSQPLLTAYDPEVLAESGVTRPRPWPTLKAGSAICDCNTSPCSRL